MRLILNGRSFALALVAALVAVAPAPAGEAAKAGKDDHKAAKADKSFKAELFVKEGDKYRPATDTELHRAADDAPAHGHGAGTGILDKLDFTGIKRYDLGIYTLIVFGLLMFVLTKFAWPHIKEGLEKREQNIRGALDEAKRDREESKVALEAAKKQLDEAAAKVKAMLDEARKDAEVLKASKHDEGVRDAAAERERAKREIEAAKEVALKDITEQAVRLASLMSEKALRRSVSADDHRRLLDESIAELKTAANRA